MRSEWLRGVSEQDKEVFKKKLEGGTAKAVLSKEQEILEQWLEAEFLASIGDEDFGSPNWAAQQAYRKGKMRAYKEILSLFKGLTNK